MEEKSNNSMMISAQPVTSKNTGTEFQYFLRSTREWRYKIKDEPPKNAPVHPPIAVETSQSEPKQLESFTKFKLKECPVEKMEASTSSTSEVSRVKEEPIINELEHHLEEPTTSNVKKETEIAPSMATEQNIYDLNKGNLLYVRFPQGVPPVPEVMKLHPAVTNVLLSVYEAARFCYLVFPSAKEAENARKDLSKLEKLGKISLKMDDTLDKIIDEKEKKSLRVRSKIHRRRGSCMCRFSVPKMPHTSKNLNFKRQAIRVGSSHERESVMQDLIREVRFLNQLLADLKKHKFLIKMRKCEVLQRLDQSCSIKNRTQE